MQLDLIYAYYKTPILPLAQAAIDRFIRLNPTHPNIDCRSMRGLTNMALDDSALQGSLASIVAIAILNMHELRLVTFPNWCAAIRTVSTPPMPPKASGIPERSSGEI